MLMRTQKWMVLGPAGWFQKPINLELMVAMLGRALAGRVQTHWLPSTPATDGTAVIVGVPFEKSAANLSDGISQAYASGLGQRSGSLH